jgi:hypothetical protein
MYCMNQSNSVLRVGQILTATIATSITVLTLLTYYIPPGLLQEKLFSVEWCYGIGFTLCLLSYFIPHFASRYMPSSRKQTPFESVQNAMRVHLISLLAALSIAELAVIVGFIYSITTQEMEPLLSIMTVSLTIVASHFPTEHKIKRLYNVKE